MLPPELQPKLPPVSNKVLYAYRVLGKWFSFFIFGLGSLVLALIFLPLMRLFIHPKIRFQKYGRRMISLLLRFFVFVMHSIKIVNLEFESRDAYRNISSKIIVANHPSLLDVVMIISLITNADCIVNSYLTNGILRGIVRQLFILNSMDTDEFFKTCEKSLKYGNNIIIFPEGTRTPRNRKVILKKGAARISLLTGCNILPIHIGGTDKFGLGKKDPWTGFNPTARYVYRLSMEKEISPEKFRHLPPPAAAKLMTMEIANALSLN